MGSELGGFGEYSEFREVDVDEYVEIGPLDTVGPPDDGSWVYAEELEASRPNDGFDLETGSELPPLIRETARSLTEFAGQASEHTSRSGGAELGNHASETGRSLQEMAVENNSRVNEVTEVVLNMIDELALEALDSAAEVEAIRGFVEHARGLLNAAMAETGQERLELSAVAMVELSGARKQARRVAKRRRKDPAAVSLLDSVGLLTDIAKAQLGSLNRLRELTVTVQLGFKAAGGSATLTFDRDTSTAGSARPGVKDARAEMPNGRKPRVPATLSLPPPLTPRTMQDQMGLGDPLPGEKPDDHPRRLV